MKSDMVLLMVKTVFVLFNDKLALDHEFQSVVTKIQAVIIFEILG